MPGNDEIDRAGRVLAQGALDTEEDLRAGKVYSDWRARHQAALTAFEPILAGHVAAVDPEGVVSSRLKRLETVRNKLRRLPKYRLSELQDIGGIRAVVESVEHAAALVEQLRAVPPQFRLERVDDYIANPKKSGYRSVHLIYSYEPDDPEQPRARGMTFEVQVRSRWQHVWATANETVSTFLGQELKSSRGDPQWLRFFAVASADIAMREGAPRVPKVPSDPAALVSELAQLRDQLRVQVRLNGYRIVPTFDGLDPNALAPYYILKLSLESPDPETIGYTLEVTRLQNFNEAHLRYQVEERNAAAAGRRADVVLVSADGLKSLREAFPNYWADTWEFIDIVYRYQYARLPPWLNASSPSASSSAGRSGLQPSKSE